MKIIKLISEHVAHFSKNIRLLFFYEFGAFQYTKLFFVLLKFFYLNWKFCSCFFALFHNGFFDCLNSFLFWVCLHFREFLFHRKITIIIINIVNLLINNFLIFKYFGLLVLSLKFTLKTIKKLKSDKNSKITCYITNF